MIEYVPVNKNLPPLESIRRWRKYFLASQSEARSRYDDSMAGELTEEDVVGSRDLIIEAGRGSVCLG